MLLQPNKIYCIGRDCEYGYYLIASQSPQEDAHFFQYESYPPQSWYRRSDYYFACIEVAPPYKVIKIENGLAVYIGKEPFDLYSVISQVGLPDSEYDRQGKEAYSNEVCNIRVHLRKRTVPYYGDALIYVDSQNFFSINERYFCCADIDVRTYKHCNNLIISVKDGLTGKSYIFGKDGIEFGAISRIGLSISDRKLKCFRRSPSELYVLALPLGVDPRKMGIAWMQPSFSSRRFFPTDKGLSELYQYERNRLCILLEKYKEFGVNIDIDAEVAMVGDAPDFAEACINFLESEYEICKQVKNNPKVGRRFTFPVDVTFDKKYYCAVKLAERAKEISHNKEKTVYYVTFDDSQHEDIALMRWNMICESNADEEYMLEISKYLHENDIFTRLSADIDHFIGSLVNESGYSSVVTKWVLLDIIKDINKKRKVEIDALYSEMVRDKRITTKWSSELTLFNLIKSLIPDAIYQYHSDWLGAQSFDIFLPSINVAIEYQGLQHYEPVDLFGGEESFKSNIERDARKLHLSKKNGVTVLYWKYDIPVDEKNVKAFLNDNNINYEIKETTAVVNKSVAKMEHAEIMKLTLEMAPIRDNQAQVNYGKSRKKMLSERPKPLSTTVIRQFDLDGKFIKEYDTIKDAASQMQISVKSITNAIYGSRKSGGGYIWKKCNRGSPVENTSPITKPENTGIGKPILQSDVNGKRIAVFPSKRAASRATGINERSISDVLSGVQKTAGGFKWSYAKKDNLEC